MVAAAVAIGGAALSAYSSHKETSAANDRQQQAIEAAKMDPRVAQILYGDNNNGLLSQYQALGQTPQNPGLATYGNGSADYLGANGLGDMQAMRNAASGLMNSSVQAPTAMAAQGQAAQGQAAQGEAAQANPFTGVASYGASTLWNTGENFSAPDPMQAARMQSASVQSPAGMQASQVGAARINAPSQNNLDLSGAYNDFINGPAGANPYLTGAIQKGINQSNNAFQSMQQDSTRNLLENVLPSIRSNAVLSGQYGGSRQGIAEGRALGDFGREQQRTLSQVGQNNTDSAVNAQAGAYESDRNRALSATQGLGSQQYGVASQNAQLEQQAALANQGANMQAGQTNYQGLLSGALANAGYQQQANATNTGNQQQANATNYAGQLGVNQANAGLRQQANLQNQSIDNSNRQFNANQQQSASLQNSQLGQNLNQFNAQLAQQMGLANLGNQQQMGLANLGNAQQTGMQNTANQQQTSLANMQSQLGTNSLNSANALSGIGASNGLLGSTLGAAQNQDNYQLNRASQTNGLLQPYLTNSGSPIAQPYMQNTAGNLIGGATAGLGLLNMYKQLNGGQSNMGDWGNYSDLFGSGSNGTLGSSAIWG